MSPSTALEVTREQDAFAEDAASTWQSVGVRLLHDGLVSVACYTAPGMMVRVDLVDEDGVALSMGRHLERIEAERERLVAAMQALDPTSDDTEDALRALATKYLLAWPQYDGKLDTYKLARASRQYAAKGGTSQEVGDLVLVSEQHGLTVDVFSLRRLGFVQTACYAVARAFPMPEA